jgi:membrane-associated protein
MTMILDIALHLDAHLNQWIASLGGWIHGVLFLVIFCETGLVVMPFLPGDSLLFALGAVAATDGSPLNLLELVVLLSFAAILGNTVNYGIGRRLGPKVFSGERRWLNKKHLEETQRFYDRHGGKTLILTRFLPIVRTFAPFVAGAGGMPFARFAAYNVAGGLLWVGACLLAGYFFGNIPFVKRHFDLVVAGIIFVSMLPFVIRVISGALKKRKAHDSVPERTPG